MIIDADNLKRVTALGQNAVKIMFQNEQIWPGEEIIPTEIPYITFRSPSLQVTFYIDRSNDYSINIEYSLNNGQWSLLGQEQRVVFGSDLGDLRLRGSENWNGTAKLNVYGSYYNYRNIFKFLYDESYTGECQVHCLGDIRTLIDYQTYDTCDTRNAKFCGLFSGAPIVSAPDLPATTLGMYCYSGMFQDCTSLTVAPALPATTAPEGCYSGMFQGCSSLTTAPTILPATTLVMYCYRYMFKDCTSLTVAPELPATALAYSCYESMFYHCTSLTVAPALPATRLPYDCYFSMFLGCTSLTVAPALPATTLDDDCYSYMFYGCTSLTAAPELPATALVSRCYKHMFYNCNSLTVAPELPATTLAYKCYEYMFYNCTNLNYIKAMFTTTPSTSYTQNWVQNVASTGTFVKNSAATWTTTGVNGIPSGWTVQTATS